MADAYQLFTPNHSPISLFDEEEYEYVPNPRRKLKGLARRLGSIMQAKEEADKVYGKAYFENHYPTADRRVKELLHDKIQAAYNAMERDDEEDDREDRKPSVIINIGT